MTMRTLPRGAAVALLLSVTALAGAADRGHAAALGARLPGGLMFKPGQGEVFAVAPLVDTDITTAVTGVIARTRVRQRFVNPTAAWLEGVYVFPLPEDAAVDTMRMRIGDRVIVSHVEPRETAQRTYAAAKAAGHAPR